MTKWALLLACSGCGIQSGPWIQGDAGDEQVAEAGTDVAPDADDAYTNVCNGCGGGGGGVPYRTGGKLE